MTKSEIFSQAHVIAKETRNLFNTYRGAFSVALVKIYAELRKTRLISKVCLVWNDSFRNPKEKVITGKVDGLFCYMAEDGSMWKNAELL